MKKTLKITVLAASACLLALTLWLGWEWYDAHTVRSGVTVNDDRRDDPVTNTQPSADSTCCPDKSTVPTPERKQIKAERKCLSEIGEPRTGWLTEGEYRYYFLPDGTMATGEQEIDGKTYYFTPTGIEVLLVNAKNPLADDYDPTLVEIEDGFRVDVRCLPSLQAMIAAMRAEGLLPMFSSAYRSKSHQSQIWKDYVNDFLASGYSPSQANAMTAVYVAKPGTSEHHTGLAVDIVGRDYFYGSPRGATTAVQKWLAEHCWEYGFILRYTEEKRSITGFAPESWHFRYVGREVSMAMKDTGLCLEEYIGAAP